MKTRKIIAIVLCVVLTASVFCLRAVSGSFPDTVSQQELGKALGIFSLLPTFLAVALAFLLGDVTVALLIGLFLGELMLLVFTGSGIGHAIAGLMPRAVDELIGVASDADNAKVLLLCALVGGLVGILMKTGGFAAGARIITRKIKSPRRANLLGQLFCMLFFFDDYANALITGPILRPIADKAGISRERLAYIVDSTAAPVAGIAVVSSWVAVELSVISDGIKTAGIGVSPFSMFVSSIPYCFYCIFALIFMLVTSLSGREYGPMLEFERRAREKTALSDTDGEEGATENEKKAMIIAFGSIVLLVAYLAAALAADAGETITLLLQAAFLCGVTALAACSVTGIMNVSEGVKAWLEGASGILPTMTVLLLAWSLAAVVERLGTVYFVVELISSGIMWQLVPAIIFICCCAVSFAAGSYGCMFMVMPMAIPIAAAVMAKNPAIDGSFMLLCVASVLSGGIFGDHCSPMTDCTILAALGSGCEVMDHAVTQMPYALTVAAVSIICLTVTTLGLPVIFSIALGVLLITGVIFTFGKRP